MAGTALGKAGGGTTAGDGGLAIRVDGTDLGVRNNVAFRNTPGVRWLAVDTPAPSPARMVVTAEIDAEVQLAPASVALDLTAAPGVVATLLASIAAQLEHVTKIVLISTDVSGVAVQPSVRAHTDVTLLGNLAPTQALVFTGPGQVFELALASLRPGIDPGPSTFDEAILDLVSSATATTYEVTAQIWGAVLTP